MIQLFKQFDSEISYFIFKFQKLFSHRMLKTVTLSCISSEFVEMFFRNVGSLIEIVYLDLLKGTLMQI